MLDTIQILLLSFLPCFSQERTFKYLVDFFWGIVSIKRKTVTGIYLQSEMSRHFTNYYRFLKKYKWDTLSLSKKLYETIREKTTIFAGKCQKDNIYLVLDSTFAKKSGKNFDGVDFHFDHSSKPNTPKYIWGHCVFILGNLITSPCCKRMCFPFMASLYLRQDTIKKQKLSDLFVPMLDKAVDMIISVKDCFKGKIVTVVADAFFSKKNFFKPLFESGIYVLTRCRKDAVAYEPAPPPKEKKRGRPKLYGDKIKLRDLLSVELLESMTVKISGKKRRFEYVLTNLLLKGYAGFARFLIIKEKTPVILMTTNLNMSAEEMLQTYCARFQIEFSIRELKQELGFEDYQVRRSWAIEKFLNITILVNSLLKIAFVTDKKLQGSVRKQTSQPWRGQEPVFSIKEVLSILRNEIMIKRFLDISGFKPKQQKIPAFEQIPAINWELKC